MQTFFKNNNSDKLIILLCGWGMDEKPFLPLKEDRDILFVFDYSEKFPQDIISKNLFKDYKEKYLIAFSAGVLMSGYLIDILPEFDLKIAINGVFNLFDNDLGIPSDILSKMKNINLNNYMEFRKLLFENSKDLELFNKNQPARTLESSLKELAFLDEYSKKNSIDFNFDKIIISRNDEIIPLTNQQKSWNFHNQKQIIESGHFPFYNFKPLLK